MPNVTIYHNPKCSKSRQTLTLIEEQNIQPVVIEYLKTPITKQELKHLLSLLGITARELIRSKEQIFKDKQLDNPALSDDELLSAMIEHPILIERPIVVVDDKAIIGRPPENVLEIL